MKVLCINARCVEKHLELNKIYTVVCTLVEKGIKYYRLDGIKDDYFSAERFKIINEEGETINV